MTTVRTQTGRINLRDSSTWDSVPLHERTSTRRTGVRQVRGRNRPAEHRTHKGKKR